MEFVWRVQGDASGSHVVIRPGHSGPWLYVRGPEHDPDDTVRYAMCRDLAAFLNRVSGVRGQGSGNADTRHLAPGTSPPLWLGNLVRDGGDCLEDVDGSSILAVGPMFQRARADDWQQNDSPEFAEERRKLIDLLERAGNQAERIVGVAFQGQ